MEYQNFDVEISEGSARIGLIGSGAPDMGLLCDEMINLFLRLQEDNAVRVILFSDGDHSFDFHHSLDALAESPGSTGGLEILAADDEIGRRIVTLIQEMHKPVIAATRGDIQNNGLGFYLAADIRLASEKATFTAPDVSTGLAPGWGLSHTLPHQLGPGRALDFLWSKRTLTADEAHRIGLVDRVIAEDRWEEELDQFMDRLRCLPQPMVHLTKLGTQQAATLDMTSMLSFEWESQQQCWASLETVEGLNAWQEGRAPRLDAALTEEDD
ncbi:MAG: enoyl-CoA hydratase/isomerase family protein [Gemmatimonadales bacterium]|nr:enoyl-CoA hydratase/isomerase family protein [Gemmatimonadales bacterium]